MMYLCPLVVFSSLVALAQADTVELATCPQEPDVVGIYYNNGKKCIRDRQEFSRDIIEATCKSGDLQFSRGKAFCEAQNGTKFNAKDTRPICPTDYRRYNDQCHKLCPAGFTSKKGKCIRLADKLPPHYMKCSHDKHKFDAFCCEGDQCSDLLSEEKKINPSSLMECSLSNIPGKFYYSPTTKKCERQMSTQPRKWTRLPTNNRGNRYRLSGSCQEGETQIMGGCQLKCPESWSVRKAMCQLRPCSIPLTSNNKIVLCPEGKYQMQSASI
jgi:hypothetical protein